MTFREIIEQYKSGLLPEEQKSMVETEIEKHEAISDYLADSLDLPDAGSFALLGGDDNDSDDEQADKFANMINASIRRAFIKMGAVVGAVILFVVLCAVFVLPHIVSALYYNPTEIVGSSEYNETNRLSLDLSVYSELLTPGKYRNYADAQPEGYGKYSITIPQTTSYSGYFTNIGGRITRNELLLYNPNLLTRPSTNSFIISDDEFYLYEGMGAAGTAEEAFAATENLNDNTYYNAYFSLAETTDYDDFAQWCFNNNISMYELWCGVYTGNTHYGHLGFCPIQSGGYVIDWDREEYPLLCMIDSQNSSPLDSLNDADGETMKTHFVSMLRYMNDNPKSAKLLGADDVDWAAVIEYAENNELRLFGFMVTAQKDKIAAIAADDAVAYVYTTPAE